TVPLTSGLVIRLDDSTNSDQVELYARYGLPPTRESYDYGSSAAGAHKSTLIPSALAGDWYVLVYGQKVPAPSAFALQVIGSSLLVVGATPDRSAANIDLMLTVTGAGFGAGAAVSLIDSANVAHAVA